MNTFAATYMRNTLNYIITKIDCIIWPHILCVFQCYINTRKCIIKPDHQRIARRIGWSRFIFLTVNSDYNRIKILTGTLYWILRVFKLFKRDVTANRQMNTILILPKIVKSFQSDIIPRLLWSLHSYVPSSSNWMLVRWSSLSGVMTLLPSEVLDTTLGKGVFWSWNIHWSWR